MKTVIISLAVLLIMQFSPQNAQYQSDHSVNCLWREERIADVDSFTLSASLDALQRSKMSESSSFYHCLTKVEVTSSDLLYYQLSTSSRNNVWPDCVEGSAQREYIRIRPVNGSGDGIQTCLKHIDLLIIQLPQIIEFISEELPTTGFDIHFHKVLSPCIGHKLEATADQKPLFSPLYNVVNSPTSFSCKVYITVPHNNVLFMQIRRNPSHPCNGSLSISGTWNHYQEELCGVGLRAVVLEPINYTDGITLNFTRERNKYFSGFQLEYWAIKRVVQDCRNLSSISLPVTSEPVSYELRTAGSLIGGYCDFHLDANRKAVSLPFVSDIPKRETVEISTGHGTFTEECHFLSHINKIRAPPGKAVRIRIKLCRWGRCFCGPMSLVIVAVAEDADSFPKAFYTAYHHRSYIWIPKDLTRKPESLTFSVTGGLHNHCLAFSTAQETGHYSGSDGPKLSAVANFFAGTGNTSFDFSRGCNGKARDDRSLHSNSSSTVTVQIKRDLSEGFWLVFNTTSARNCRTAIETSLDDDDAEAGVIHPNNHDIWRENMLCKWTIRASKDNFLKYRGQIHNHASIELTVRDAATGQVITAFPESPTWNWYNADFDIEVYAHVKESLHVQNSFDFQYEREDFSDSKMCSSRSTTVLTTPTTIFSPNYPNYSFGSSRCKWLLRQKDSDSAVSVRFSFLSPLSCGSNSFFLITYQGDTQKTCYPTALEEIYHGDVLIELVTSIVEPVPGFSFIFSFSSENCPRTPSMLMATSQPRSITSSGYPSCYPPHLDCSWWIVASGGMKIRIVIIDVKIESSIDCRVDALDIFDGDSDSSHSLASICGQNIQNGAHIISSSSEVYLHFYSDAGLCYKGFNLTYEQIEAGSQDCGGQPVTLYADATPTNLESPGYPHGYADNLRCSWIIRSSLNIVEIFVNDIHLEEHHTCDFDFLEIYDGQDRNADRLAKLCKPFERLKSYRSTSDVILIYFHSDSHARGGGFQLSFQSKKFDDPTGEDDHSANYSHTGAIVGGNIAATLGIFSVVVGYICVLQRRRRRSAQRRRRNNHTSGTGTNSNSTRNTSSVCVINPIIINTDRRHSSSSEPPPYPGLSDSQPEIVLSCEDMIAEWQNIANSHGSDVVYSGLEAPPEYSEIANTYQSIQPPAYSDTSRGPVSTSDNQPDSSNTAEETSNAPNDQSGPPPVELDENSNNNAEYVDLQDAPPEYELARPIQDDPPPAYEPRPIPSYVTRHLGPF